MPAVQPKPTDRNAQEGVGPIAFGVQGVLYLVDTPEDNGAFCETGHPHLRCARSDGLRRLISTRRLRADCVPKFHKRIGPWLSGLAPDADPKQEDLMALGPTRVPGRAGDMVIWQFSWVATFPRPSFFSRPPSLNLKALVW